mmetsp:Transcript_30053/g.78681  ORF Transcript_30053/g.78681 Transcript_30053/m.78681 type:complete len:240 (-) Transcript_30053:113-832(-)
MHRHPVPVRHVDQAVHVEAGLHLRGGPGNATHEQPSLPELCPQGHVRHHARLHEEPAPTYELKEEAVTAVLALPRMRLDVESVRDVEEQLGQDLDVLPGPAVAPNGVAVVQAVLPVLRDIEEGPVAVLDHRGIPACLGRRGDSVGQLLLVASLGLLLGVLQQGGPLELPRGPEAAPHCSPGHALGRGRRLHEADLVQVGRPPARAGVEDAPQRHPCEAGRGGGRDENAPHHGHEHTTRK